VSLPAFFLTLHATERKSVNTHWSFVARVEMADDERKGFL